MLHSDHISLLIGQHGWRQVMPINGAGHHLQTSLQLDVPTLQNLSSSAVTALHMWDALADSHGSMFWQMPSADDISLLAALAPALYIPSKHRP